MFKIIAFFINNAVSPRLYERIGILLTCEQQLYCLIISLRVHD
jgi:hypothetical protein